MYHIHSVKKVYIPVQKLKILQVNFCVQRQVDILGMTWSRDFFTIIWAVMNEIKIFFREQLRINGDIYDAKYEMLRVNNKRYVAKKRILQVHVYVQRLSPSMHLVPFSRLFGP